MPDHITQLRIQHAQEAIRRLDTEHRKLLAAVRDAADEDCAAGRLTADGDVLLCTTLGHELRGWHRPIEHNERIALLEYVFKLKWRGEEHAIFKMYLHFGGLLSSDPAGKVALFHSAEASVAHELPYLLADALLSSPVFSLAAPM